MSWIFCNPNPLYNLVEDCTVRAISIAMNQDWHKTYLGIAMKGNDMCNMPQNIDTRDPNNIIQYLLNTNQVSQDQVNRAAQMSAQFR